MRKQTVKTWRIDNPVYNYSLFLRCGGTIAEANAWAKRVIGFECDVDTDDACGRTYLPDDSNDHAIWLDRKAGAATVAHESLHSIAHVMRGIGQPKLSKSSEESWAYLMSWTVGEIGSRIWSRKS